jgi:two-component system nitrogen regulation sensor histidine kinase NtrY
MIVPRDPLHPKRAVLERAHASKRHATWALLAPLLLAWLAPWANAGPNLWYALCTAATLAAGVGLWKLSQLIDAPLNTAANLVTALREGNYSLRGPTAAFGGAARLLMRELNALGEALRSRRLDETESSELLQKVMSEIDTAVLALDAQGRVVLENHAAASLLGRKPGGLAGETLAGLGVSLDLEAHGLLRFDADLPGELGPFELRVQPFRYRGRPHTLLVLTSLARLIRDEERRAQRRIIRVLSHEINNSLAPIKSLAGRLQTLATRLVAAPAAVGAPAEEPARLSDPQADLRTGLAVIERRAEHLGRVMADYAKLARTADPSFRAIRVGDWIERNARLWPGLAIESGPGDLLLSGDEALLDQVLLNLLKNAFEAIEEAAAQGATAAAEHGPEPPVCLSWRANGRWLSLAISDRGSGLRGDVDPFLPFVTTKPNGSGIGLALCREVVDAHGGRLELENRSDRPGCRATLTLPLRHEHDGPEPQRPPQRLRAPVV